MTFAMAIVKKAIQINKYQEQKFTELLSLKGENIFDTFMVIIG